MVCGSFPMGNGIELFRIAFYLFFPVGMFYYFNRPAQYENMLKERERIWNPEGRKRPKSLQEMLDMEEERIRIWKEKREKQKQKEQQNLAVDTK